MFSRPVPTPPLFFGLELIQLSEIEYGIGYIRDSRVVESLGSPFGFPLFDRVFFLFVDLVAISFIRSGPFRILRLRHHSLR